jgi:hypothetical protein
MKIGGVDESTPPTNLLRRYYALTFFAILATVLAKVVI